MIDRCFAVVLKEEKDMECKSNRKMRVRILGVLMSFILLAGNFLSAVQPVYAGSSGGKITEGNKTYTYATHGRKEDSFSFSIGGGYVTVESVPQELKAKSKDIRVSVSKSGKWVNGWENNQFEFEHEYDEHGWAKYRYSGGIVSFPHKIPLPKDDGVFHLVVSVETDSSWETYNLHFTVAGDDAFFRLGKSYENNEKIFSKRPASKTALWAFTRPHYKKGSKEDKLIQKTAEKIVNKGDSDYEKVRKVHDWVANNIWYDQDYANGKTEETAYTPVEVLESKKTVCGGYTFLTRALLRSLGIPTTVPSNSIHGWNEAYVDGRWVILDTTWDSLNKYKDGTFSEAKPCLRDNFDISLEAFSEMLLIGQNSYDPDVEIFDALWTSLSISKKSLTLKKGKTKQISVKAADKGIDFKDLSITYSSSNKKVATVSKNGKITAKKTGTAIIKTQVKIKGSENKDLIITFETKVTVKK